jgi:hypothetical protein
MGTVRDPKWWSKEHGQVWERVKAAMRRDWEQTKADVSDGGEDLNQNAGDTIKQAAGKQPIPPDGVKTRPFDRDDVKDRRVDSDERAWDDVEEGYRFGVGARRQYENKFSAWDDGLEKRLEQDWSEIHGEDKSSWGSARDVVRRAYERSVDESASGGFVNDKSGRH